MSIKLTWYGHATWMVHTSQHRVLIDPFFNDNPSSPIKADDVEADFILISHGHFDHIADCASIANRLKIPVLACYEIATWLGDKFSVENCLGMNLGGNVEQPFGTAKMTPAWHSSQLPDGSYGGNPGGWLLTIEGIRLYFACDTALFSDMKLIGEQDVQVAVLPIGDLFTMGIEDSVQATKWIEPKVVLPSHYNTWPPIEQDAAVWAERIRNETSATPEVLKPGETYEV